MNNKGFIAFVVVAFIAVALFVSGGNGLGFKQADSVNAPTGTTAVEQPAKPATPEAATFDQVIKAVTNDAKNIDKVVLIKDAAGNIQEVLVTFRAQSGKTSLKTQVPGEAGIARILSATEGSGVTTDTQKQEVKQTGPWDVLMSIISFILPIVIIFFLFRFLMRGAMNAQSGIGKQLGNSKATKVMPDKDKKTFADVAGCEEAKQELVDVINYLRDPGLLAYLGGKPYKGVLLIGGPGNGKTLLAKAVAGEANAAFFSISASQFVEMFVGVGAARVRDLFDQARGNKPAIVFIDEIDAVGRQRGTGMGGGNDEREQTLNQLLVEMDGFTSNDGILLIAATNRPDVLDPALIRPGRFGDLQVLVDNADKKGRKDILGIHTRKKKLAADVDLDTLATNTPGFSGAELEGLTNHGAFVASRRIMKMRDQLRKEGVSEKEIAERVKKEITMADLDEGSDRVQMGPAKEDIVERMSEDDLWNTNYHELGHAWISQDQYERGLGGDPVTKITIVPRARALGYTQALPKGDRTNYSDQNLRARIMMAMGGRAAQELFLNRVDTGASNDFKQAKAWALRMVTEFGMSPLGPISIGEGGGNPFLGRQMATDHTVGPALQDKIDAEWMKIVNECYQETKKILARDEECIRKIAQILQTKKTILGPEFARLRAESNCAVGPCDGCPNDEVIVTTQADTGASKGDGKPAGEGDATAGEGTK